MKKNFFDEVVPQLFPYLVEVHPTNIGEPMISDWFVHFCNKAIEYGVLLDITTNGTLLSERIAAILMPRLTDIKISFDGARKDTYEHIRRGASFEHVMRNIKLLLRERTISRASGTVTLQMTLISFNYRELPDLVRLARDIGVDRVKAYHVFSYSKAVDCLSMISDMDAFEDIRLQSLELSQSLGVRLEVSESCRGRVTDLEFRKCRLPWAECWIDSDGAVYPCHSHRGFVYGNLHEARFESIWRGDSAAKLRNALVSRDRASICSGCGMNYRTKTPGGAVPYDASGFLHRGARHTTNDPVRWSARTKQFPILEPRAYSMTIDSGTRDSFVNGDDNSEPRQESIHE